MVIIISSCGISIIVESENSLWYTVMLRNEMNSHVNSSFSAVLILIHYQFSVL